MEYNVVFESERISFVRVTEKLVNEYLEMVNDIEVQQFISHKRKVYTYEGEIAWINDKLSSDAPIFSMIEKATRDFIGNIEIMDIHDNIGELGITITVEKQDKHFGQEAIKRIIEYAFNELGLDGLDLNVYKTNPRGIRCYEKVGFVETGVGKTEEDVHMIINR